uniref:Neutral amino acid transporter 9 n=1 Tax=Phallusia mammillata TaxID=59560 RepID=A0A6F9DTB9_9ASCI|nr:putative sodium-coupled neutral amino acid transporter 9 [Phallusia mammillata]
MDNCDETSCLIASQKENYLSLKKNAACGVDCDDNVADTIKDETRNTEDDKKQSSIVTIFSLWNMLMGSTLLSMPWAFGQAGLAQGILVQILMCTVAFYTAYILLKVSKKLADPITKEMPEMLDLCEKLVGRWAGWLAIIGSFVVMGGALIVYWIIMAQLLYNSVNSIRYFTTRGRIVNLSQNATAVQCNTNKSQQLTSGHSSSFPGWSEDLTVPLLFIPIFLPILQLKKMTFFSKLGAFGTISVVFLLSMVLVKCIIWGPNMDFYDHESQHYIPQFLGSFPALSGLLGMAYFIHNSISTVFNNNQRSENNVRDLTAGYALVFLTYVFIGLGIYLTFPQSKGCIQQNFLENLLWNDWLSLATQLIILIRLFTVYPMVAYILRVHLFVAIYGKPYPGKLRVAVLSIVLVTSCVLCAIFFPNIGDIIRYAGAFCGMLIMFFLPCLLHVLLQMREGLSSKLSTTFHVIIALVGVVNFAGQFTVYG